VKLQNDNEEFFFSYLLGELSEEEEERIEQRYLSEQKFYDRLLAAEDELIDSYAQRKLSQAQRERFENHFLRSPARRERVIFAQTWMKYVSDSAKVAPLAQEKARSKAGFSFQSFLSGFFLVPLAAAVLLAVVSSLLLLNLKRLRSELEQVKTSYAALETRQQGLQQQVDEQSAQNEQLAQQLKERDQPAEQSPDDAGPRTSAPLIAVLNLTPGQVRDSGESKQLLIHSGTSRVRLRMNFRQSGYNSYQAILKTVDGDEVERQSGLKTISKATKAVVWNLRADRLDARDYILILSGITESGDAEEVANYTFKVVKK
jgi:hypothetical protein